MSEKTDRPDNRIIETLIRSFFSMVQTSRIHSDNNQLALKCAQNFVVSCQAAFRNQGELRLRIANDRLYVQEETLGFQRGTVALIQNMVEYLERRSLGGFNISEAIRQCPLEEVLNAARLINNAQGQQDPFEWLTSELEACRVHWITPQPHSETDLNEPAMELKERALKTYSYALTSVKDVVEKIATHKHPGIRHATRLAQSMVDLMIENESVFMALSTIRDYDDYTFTHSVNVAILSMCLAKHIGVPKQSLERLSLCGLFHDLGKIDIPKSIINKEGKLTDEEFKQIQMHSLLSVQHIATLRASRERKASMLIPPFEHHLKYDLSGYPQTHRRNPISFFGRILTISDVFDAITSPRIYRPTALSPDRALKFMYKGTGKDFDPVLLKAFIDMIGLLPLGTVLELDTGELAVVVKNGKPVHPARPRAVVLNKDEQTGEFYKGKTISLADKDLTSGKYLRNIVGTRHCSHLNIQPVDFML